MLQIGTPLHFWPDAIHGKQPQAAVVISLRRGNVVDVSVFQANGTTTAVNDVPVIDVGDTAEGAHCTWPAQDQSTPVAQSAFEGFRS